MPCVRKLNNTAVTTIIEIPPIVIVSPNASLLLLLSEAEDIFTFPDRINERAPSIKEVELIDEFDEEEPFPLLFLRLVFLGMTRYIYIY